MSKQKAYMIDWLDSAGISGWANPSSVDDAMMECQSIGFYVKETDKSITIALSKNMSGRCVPYSELVSIPKCAIKKKKQIKI